MRIGNLMILTFITLFSCAVSKNQIVETKYELFSVYNESIDGELTLYILDETKFHCDSTVIQIIAEGVDLRESLVLLGVAVVIKPIDRDKGQFLIHSGCHTDSPRLIIAYIDENGIQRKLKELALNKFM